MDVIAACLKWILTWQVFDLAAAFLISVGIPPAFAGIIAIGLLMLGYYKYQSDRYMLQRWRRKIRGKW